MQWRRFTLYWPIDEGNPAVVGGFPSKEARDNARFWSFLSEQAVEQKVDLPVIWHVMTLM